MTKTPQFAAMTIGERIRWLIEHRGYLQSEVAEKCGVTQAAISNLVTDNSRKPNAFTLVRLADALNAAPSWILYGEGPIEPRALPTKTDEAELLRAYRAMGEEQRQVLMKFLKINDKPRS